MRRALALPLALSVACVTWIVPAPALAAGDDPVAKARALDKAHKPADAADAWEKAYETSKTPKHLFYAGRDRQKSGTPAKAANDYARYLAAAPETERKERAAAQRQLTVLGAKLGRLAVRASGSDKITVDGELVDPKIAESWYVTAGPHTVEATFGKQTAKEQGTAVIGQNVAVVVAPPPEPDDAPQVPPPGADSPSSSSSGTTKTPGPRFTLSPLVAYIGGGVTVVLGGLTIVSALDVASQKAAFDKDKSQANLDEGKSKQSRTNILLVSTAVVGVATGVVAITLVDWKRTDMKLGLGPGSVFVAGRF